MEPEEPGTTVQARTTFRERRAASVWTRIHPIFAIGQLLVFVVSLVLLALYFAHVVPFSAVHVSVLVKVAFMTLAVVTGSLWERDVYGQWWFAPQFLVEDVMTANVFLLHVAYLAMYYLFPAKMATTLALLVVAYSVYALNVGQYIVSHLRTRKALQEPLGLEDIAA
jgi:3-vinyl bacteriochlorophyllide hydratase